jgi:hypothetical protein
LTDLPSPLTPLECDLRDFAFMPLDVVRLRDSDLAADETPEACWAAVLLWCVSWHQVPASSLPDDDEWIAKRAKYWHKGKIDKDWKAVREGALRGWVKCSDGRLYHPVVSEKAREAWLAKLKQRFRTECSRIKKHCQRYEMTYVEPDFDEWMALGCPVGQKLNVPGTKAACPEDKPRDSHGTKDECPGIVPQSGDSKGQGEGYRQGQGQGQGQGIPKTPVPDGTDAEASQGLSAHEAIFQIAVPWFVANGGKEANVRSMLGGAEKHLSPDGAWQLAQECMAAKPLEPVSWLVAALNARKKVSAAPARRNGFPSQSELDAENAKAKALLFGQSSEVIDV